MNTNLNVYSNVLWYVGVGFIVRQFKKKRPASVKGNTHTHCTRRWPTISHKIHKAKVTYQPLAITILIDLDRAIARKRGGGGGGRRVRVLKCQIGIESLEKVLYLKDQFHTVCLVQVSNVLWSAGELACLIAKQICLRSPLGISGTEECRWI